MKERARLIEELEAQIQMFTKIKELYNVDFEAEVLRLRRRVALLQERSTLAEFFGKEEK